MDVYEQLLKEMSLEFPDFEIRPKATSPRMKVIDTFLKAITFGQMKSFMTSFITTVKETVYVPGDWGSLDSLSKAAIIRHERVHMRQRKRMGSVRFVFNYLFWVLPTVFAIGRRNLEQEAYEESLRAHVDYEGISALDDKEYRAIVISQFTTANYFWTFPFRQKMERWYDGIVDKIRKEKSAG